MDLPRILRWTAFCLSAMFLVAAAVGAFTSDSRGILTLEFPASKAEVTQVLANGADDHRSATKGDNVFLWIYSAQFAAWVLWAAWAVKTPAAVRAASCGAALMMVGAAVWDHRENAQLFALFDAADAARLDRFDLGPLRAASAHKWGLMGIAMVLGALANSGGAASRVGSARTWICLLGGVLGMIGGHAGYEWLGASARRMLFSAEALLLFAAAVTVAWETMPHSRSGYR